MKTYDLKYTETAVYYQSIKANSQEEAENKFLDSLANMEIQPNETCEGYFDNNY